MLIGALILIGLFASSSYTYDYGDPNYVPYFPGIDSALPLAVSFYSTFLIIFGCISASLMWAEMRNKSGRLTILMNPTSTLEKYLVKLVIYVFIYILVFVTGVIIAESIRYLLFHCIYPDARILPLYLTSRYSAEAQDYIWHIFSPPMIHPIWVLVLLFFDLQSFFILGASLWYSRSFLKSFLIFGGMIVTFYISAGLTYEFFISYKIGEWPEIFYWIGEHNYLSFFVFSILLCIVNWSLAYFRIPETELITTKR